MLTFWVIIRLANGERFAGPVSARNAGHARTVVRARVGHVRITFEEVTPC